MDTLEGLKKLAQKASQEETPFFSVAETVRLRIMSQRPRQISLIPLGLVGCLSAVAASVIVALSVHLWQYMSNPVIELLAPLQETPLW